MKGRYQAVTRTVETGLRACGHHLSHVLYQYTYQLQLVIASLHHVLICRVTRVFVDGDHCRLLKVLINIDVTGPHFRQKFSTRLGEISNPTTWTMVMEVSQYIPNVNSHSSNVSKTLWMTFLSCKLPVFQRTNLVPYVLLLLTPYLLAMCLRKEKPKTVLRR